MKSFHRDYPVLIPYQVDFSTKTVGRHIRQTKRHCVWRFGFAHIPSILSNKTGVQCRGIEIEIHLVWSVASGKQIVYLNDIAVFQTASSSSLTVMPSQRFEHSVYVPETILPGGHIIHITAWALGFGSRAALDKQFMMTFDGQDYNHFYPIYQIGSRHMMERYTIALEKARAKISRDPNGSNISAADSKSISQASGADNMVGSNSIVGDRPRRKNNQSSQGVTDSNSDSNANYWQRSSIPLPPRSPARTYNKQNYTGAANRNNNEYPINRTYSGASAPELDLLSGEVAKDDLEEEMLIAKARLNSLRDLKRRKEQAESNAYASNIFARNGQEEAKLMAQARLNSFRDLRGDDMSVPSFARPPTHTINAVNRHQRPSHLQSVQEGQDLLDVDEPFHQAPGLVRSPSNLTLDTAIKTPEDDLMSMASDVYSHLDPHQNWKTQQNLSFRLQKPPVYADTAAGDLIQPTPSTSTQSFYGGAQNGTASGYRSSQATPQSAMNYAGRHMAYPSQAEAYRQTQNRQYQQQQQQQQQYQNWNTSSQRQSFTSPTNPGMSSNMSFTAAPPPTFETLNEAFAPSPSVAGNHASQQQYPASAQMRY